jgi:hypothetical protein
VPVVSVSWEQAIMGVGGSDSGGTKRTQQIENENEDDDEKDCSKHRATLKGRCHGFVRLPDMRQPDI